MRTACCVQQGRSRPVKRTFGPRAREPEKAPLLHHFAATQTGQPVQSSSIQFDPVTLLALVARHCQATVVQASANNRAYLGRRPALGKC
jgi:hypothetical protein